MDRADETKVIKADGGKTRAPLDILASLPLSVMVDVSFTSTKSPIAATQNGSFELPQDISLFLAGAWTSHVGSFMQTTYSAQKDHFTSDNTDIRYANTTKLSGKEFLYGFDLNNNPTVEDLWNSTPAWGYPWVASDWAPTPAAAPIIQGHLAQDVAGVGAFGMWNNHLYMDVAGYRSEHIGGPQPIAGTGAWSQHSWPRLLLAGCLATAHRENAIRGGYLWHPLADDAERSRPTEDSTPTLLWTRRSIARCSERMCCRFPGAYVHENNDLIASVAQGLAGQIPPLQHGLGQCGISFRQSLYRHIRVV